MAKGTVEVGRGGCLKELWRLARGGVEVVCGGWLMELRR